MRLCNSKELLFLSVLILMLGTTSGFACRVIPPSTTKLVEDAEFIVRAKAVKYIKDPGDLSFIRYLNEPDNATIIFKVEEVLKGDLDSSEVVLNGYLTDRDDFNDKEAPYNFVRPGGRGGSCSAYEYRKDAEFLLFLKKTDGKFTIRWYGLAPTNEQLHSKDDKWITWVRNYLETAKN